MKERPILFSGPMVRAILDGTKTQTRRAVRPVGRDDGFVLQDHGNGFWPYRSADGESSFYRDSKGFDIEQAMDCPYGRPGDRLWLRETWMADPPITDDWPSTSFAGCRPRDHSLIPERYRKPQHCIYRATWDGTPLTGWTPAIHMYRWASRIDLEVLDVRVERLQDISQADARAEGAPPSHPSIDPISREFGYADFPRSWYAQLWEQINGPGSWKSNPHVWVVSFARLGREVAT